MSKFETVKRGLEANIRLRTDAAKEEKTRWQNVMARVPEHRKRMAVVLLGDAARHMTDEEIVRTCNIGMAPEGDTSTGKQALYAAGMTDTAILLGKPAPSVPEAFPATAGEFHLDPALFQAGEAMAKELKSFMATAR